MKLFVSSYHGDIKYHMTLNTVLSVLTVSLSTSIVYAYGVVKKLLTLDNNNDCVCELNS